jgi:hypothetical protein
MSSEAMRAWRIFLACVACLSGLACDSAGGGGGPVGGRSLPRVPGDPGGDGPTVASVMVPDDLSGDVPIDVAVAGTRGGTLTVAVEVSRDGGGSFRAGTVSPGPTPPAGDGRTHVGLLWHSLRDVGFRSHDPVRLRFTAGDDQGHGPAATFTTPPLGDNLRAAARHVDTYVVNYGPWSADDIAIGKSVQLAIVHPKGGDATRALVASLQAGASAADPTDDVLVLCYVSVGEDLRTSRLADAQVRADPRFRGDGTGPRVDPRGPGASGGALDGVDPRGLPSNGGTGYAAFYLDDNSVNNSASHTGDGIPDRNPAFGSLFVNAGAPGWYETVDGMTLDGPDSLAGLREVLTADYGRGLDCDGVFLDTIDTAEPNAFTNPSTWVQTNYEWTAPGFGAFIRRVHAAYPSKLILQNRGLFFFDPRHPQYAFNARGAVDFVLFESYRLDSNPADLWNTIQYPDNRYNVTPKLMAEANRPDGFKALSLGYAEGPAGQMSTATLTGQSAVGAADLLEDIRVAQQLAGFRHYLTDAGVELVNSFVRDHEDLDDHAPPAWTSTYNDHDSVPAMEPTPRVGIQQASGASGTITVRWDVALDENRVDYVLYAQPSPFDFAGDPGLASARRVVLSPSVPSDYAKGVGPGVYAHEARVPGFPAGQLQHLLIRAVDESPAANEDPNTVVLTATP